MGKMGKIRMHCIENCKRTNLIGYYDPHVKLNSGLGISYKNPEALIKDKKINAIFICTPNHLNFKLTSFALSAGKHVFCEKPPCFNSNELRQIISIEKKYDVSLMYGFNHRHHCSVKKIKQIVDSKSYGKILWMRGRYGKSVDSNFFESWRSKKELAGGGIFIDQGIHMLDLFLLLAEDFDKLHASISNRFWKLDIEDNVFATFENSRSGITASLHSTMTQWRNLFSLEIFLERGYIVLNGLRTSSNSYGVETLTYAKNRSLPPEAHWNSEQTIEYNSNLSWESELNEFISSIINKTSITSGNSTNALKLMCLVDKVYYHKNI